MKRIVVLIAMAVALSAVPASADCSGFDPCPTYGTSDSSGDISAAYSIWLDICNFFGW